MRRLAAEWQLQRIKLGARTMRYTPESVAALINPMNTAEHDNKRAPQSEKLDQGAHKQTVGSGHHGSYPE